MKFKALSTLIIWHDGSMHVFNKDDKGDLPEAVIGQYIPGQAVALKGKAAKDEPKAENADDDSLADESDANGESGDAGTATVADADAPPA